MWMEKYQCTPSLRTFFRSPALPAIKPASDRLLQGQVYRRRRKEGGKKMQAQHANQVFPLLALGSKESWYSSRARGWASYPEFTNTLSFPPFIPLLVQLLLSLMLRFHRKWKTCYSKQWSNTTNKWLSTPPQSLLYFKLPIFISILNKWEKWEISVAGGRLWARLKRF